MKHFNFLLVAIALVLTITTVSCTTMAGTQDDYYNGRETRVYGNRVYVDDPYRGTIVLERDPRTGRYYEVGGSNPYYNGYGNRYDRRYSRGYNSPNYGRTNNGSYNRNNGSYNRNNESYNRNNSSNNQNTQRPTEDDRKTKDEARKKILGN